MNLIGHAATYPARLHTLPAMLETVAPQVDILYLVLNEFTREQAEHVPRFPNVEHVFPGEDLKDTGKFLRRPGVDEYVFLLDDDIAFPPDYVETMVRWYEKLDIGRAAVGLHGVIYSDFFDGIVDSRFVTKFDRGLARPLLVNQLGTGCLMLPGDLLPTIEYMRSSRRFVDIRFARYCYEEGIALICIPRREAWLLDLNPEDSLFRTFAQQNQLQTMGEVRIFGGFSKLDPELAARVETTS